MDALAACALAAGYLLGSIPTGVLVARARGVDIRAAGSGNIGATNVARVLGKKIGIGVLVFDALKGFVPVLVVERLLADRPGVHTLAAGVALCAILGHVFPIWLRFRGGKGVATGFGVFLALAPLAALGAFAVYALVYAIWHISSVGSLTAATALVAIMAASGRPLPHILLAAAAWFLIVVRHRGNIRRLLRREESGL